MQASLRIWVHRTKSTETANATYSFIIKQCIVKASIYYFVSSLCCSISFWGFWSTHELKFNTFFNCHITAACRMLIWQLHLRHHCTDSLSEVCDDNKPFISNGSVHISLYLCHHISELKPAITSGLKKQTYIGIVLKHLVHHLQDEMLPWHHPRKSRGMGDMSPRSWPGGMVCRIIVLRFLSGDGECYCSTTDDLHLCQLHYCKHILPLYPPSHNDHL